MPEPSQPPHPPVSTVSTVARLLATAALLHGSGLDRDTATAVIDAAAYLTSTGDTDGANALLRLATTDPDTIAAAHVALRVPARRPAPEPDPTAPTSAPPPPLPRRIPGPYRDPGTPDPAGRGAATHPETAAHPTATNRPEPRAAGTTGTDGTDGLPLSETRRWQQASAAQVLPLDYAITSAEGDLTGVYTAVPIVHPPGWCDHLDTICGGCLAGWSEDHSVAVFRHGIDGASTGCRCPACRTAIPAHPDSPTDLTSPADPDSPSGPVGPADGDGHRDDHRTGLPGGGASRDTSWFGEEGS